MSNFLNRYYPTICIRRAEMRALENLPFSEKSKMLPVVLLAPWLNSIEFSNTYRVIEKSLEGTPIVVDLDRYFQSVSDLPSREQFNRLKSGDAGIGLWMETIEINQNYIPCIQFLNVSDENILEQINQARRLNRGFAFRVDEHLSGLFSKVMTWYKYCADDDTIVILDYGYRDDFQQVAAELSVKIREILDISNESKIVISGSSFPNDFSDFDDFSGPKFIASRLVYSEIMKSFGNSSIFYGDWGSTKPRRYDGGGSAPRPRIDFPTRENWIIARSKGEQWSFHDAAVRVTRLPEWDQRPVVWGTGMIEKTALGLPGSIKTGPEAIAARVNIHLYIQNNFQAPNAMPPPEGQWIDPI